ncbi:hypothetical protein CL6EHI_130520 [Entamoeba histolytica]|uniref:Uncharacterized protein n=2 Tax=Entamoeba histolytica TaxID=5759 RepID=B1N4U8_ENTH1|nr:hypothetical protein EHI_130520 [Entamoeba histolytica HM-1:IMSS]EDS89010.1 hypothetical protein EHI_130520 [Entamoeba histolytica HM-1:IMSS]GAT98918.1 hypothetical protein CL6EHI_130520 [Entamoeba histolytica]|eukprot:XP_001914215.1 hypothetical protein EHI_130520 [Entamoeba histolytica HM-1:IMSS]
MCLVKKRKQRLNLHKRRYGSYGSIRFNYNGIPRSTRQQYKPFNTSMYMSGILQNNKQGMYYTPPRPNRKETLDEKEPRRKRKIVTDIDDDLERLNNNQAYIRSVLPPELWKRIEDVAFEPNVVRRYEKLQDILVPEAITTHSSKDYYHKIHIGARTNRSDNKGTIFKPSDFERRGLHQYLYKQPHFNKVQSGQERFEVMKNVYKQLKQWGISDKRTDYEKVLLRVSPDDDKINHFKTINGTVKFYNK